MAAGESLISTAASYTPLRNAALTSRICPAPPACVVHGLSNGPAPESDFTGVMARQKTAPTKNEMRETGWQNRQADTNISTRRAHPTRRLTPLEGLLHRIAIE